MAQLSSITLPNNTKYNLKGSIHTVIGTQTAATGSWTGNLTSIDALYDGLTIAYWLPRAGSGNATLNLTLSSGTTGAINCYYSGNTRLTTHYAAGTMILLTYWSAGSININGTATTDNRWVSGPNCDDGNTIPSVYCSTAAATAAKNGSLTAVSWSGLTGNRYLVVDMYYNNTSATALTFNVNSQGAKPIYINDTASSTTNYTLPRGTYIVFYDGTNFYFRTDGKIPKLKTSGSIGISTTNVGSASAGTAIPADDITAWTTNTPTAVTKKTVVTGTSVSNEVLSFVTGDSVTVTPGTAANLSYTAKSIPNISVSSATVATGLIEA